MTSSTVFIVISACVVAQASSFINDNTIQYSRIKRNVHYNSGMYETFGNSRQAAMNQLADNQNIAFLSAHHGVIGGIGEVYGHEQTALANTVQQYLIPMKKYQQGHHFFGIPTSASGSISANHQNKNTSSNSDSTTSSSLGGKHVEKFRVDESQPSPNQGSSTAESRIPKQVNEGTGGGKGGNNGNGHRRDTAGPTNGRKENLKKISASVKSNSDQEPETSSSEKIQGEKLLSKETEVISVGEDDDEDKTE